MLRPVLTALFVTAIPFTPAMAQDSAAPANAAPAQAAPAQPAAAQPADAAAATPASTLTPEQITAFNEGVKSFTEAQKAQQAGDNAGALAKYQAALPGIRAVVQAQPDNIENTQFLSNALMATAATQAALKNVDAILPLYEESVPLLRKVVAAKPTDAPTRALFTSVLTQLGNAKLGAQDKAAAAPLYDEAAGLARKAVAEQATPANRNQLLAALIGASQAKDDPAIKVEAAQLSKTMLAEGSVDAANKPSAQILAGAAQPAPGGK